VTVFSDGVHGDTDATFPVGKADPGSMRLIEVTRECLELGIAAVVPGRPISDIGRAIGRRADAAGYSVVRSYIGHGIGEVFHNGLAIPHYFRPDATTVMEEGMTFTIEPMLNAGDWRARSWDDEWTAVTADGSRSAQFEHTLLVTAGGAEVLTR
jgi:methionyl aminopeptidase